MFVVLKIAGFKSQCKPRAFLFRKTLPLVKGWDVGCFYFLYYNKLSLKQHLIGNPALISGMAESWLNLCAPGGIFTRSFRSLARGILSPWLNISMGTSIFRLSIVPINSSDWNSALLVSQFSCKVRSSLKYYFSSNKHK